MVVVVVITVVKVWCKGTSRTGVGLSAPFDSAACCGLGTSYKSCGWPRLDRLELEFPPRLDKDREEVRLAPLSTGEGPEDEEEMEAQLERLECTAPVPRAVAVGGTSYMVSTGAITAEGGTS